MDFVADKPRPRKRNPRLQKADRLRAIRQVARRDGGTTERVFERCVEAGQGYAEAMDQHRWHLGECGYRIAQCYHDERVTDFARALKRPKRTILEYTDLFTFYGVLFGYKAESARRALSEEFPTLNYSHFRAARRLWDQRAEPLKEGQRKAGDFLRECMDNQWTADEAALEVSLRNGGSPPARPIYEGTHEPLFADGAALFRVPVHGLKPGGRYRVEIYEVAR